jgi:hypothetical protein
MGNTYRLFYRAIAFNLITLQVTLYIKRKKCVCRFLNIHFITKIFHIVGCSFRCLMPLLLSDTNFLYSGVFFFKFVGLNSSFQAHVKKGGHTGCVGIELNSHIKFFVSTTKIVGY